MLNNHRMAGLLGLLMLAPFSLLYGQGQGTPRIYEGTSGGPRIIEEGQPSVLVHPRLEDVNRSGEDGGSWQFARSGSGTAGTVSKLSYHGGIGGIGVETTPKIYLVLWGSQWSSDPSGEATILTNFYTGVGGSTWMNSVTQYCQGVASGSVTCGTSGVHAGNPAAILAGIWKDNASTAPAHPTQSQIAAEALKAASHFGNTTSTSNASVQYVIATPHGYNSSGFGTQYCAWHSWASSSAGYIAYTNLPYMTDAGASCGANFNGLGATAGITIVAGHEMGETMTDQLPSSGWTDSGGAENGDKCAWISSGQGASAILNLVTGNFAVQSLWSNAFNGGVGGCVLAYP